MFQLKPVATIRLNWFVAFIWIKKILKKGVSVSSPSEHTQAGAGFADLVEVCKPVLNNDHVSRALCIVQ